MIYDGGVAQMKWWACAKPYHYSGWLRTHEKCRDCEREKCQVSDQLGLDSDE